MAIFYVVDRHLLPAYCLRFALFYCFGGKQGFG
jgi:hypothetical protein